MRRPSIVILPEWTNSQIMTNRLSIAITTTTTSEQIERTLMTEPIIIRAVSQTHGSFTVPS